MDREEIISELVAGYKRELSELRDDELLAHWKLQKGVDQMTPEEWQVIAKGLHKGR